MRKIRENMADNNERKQGSVRELLRKNISSSIRVVILMMLMTGIAYPLILTGIGQGIFPFQSNGSMITMDGKDAVGSILIGQEFTSPKFLHTRPASQTASGVDPHITPKPLLHKQQTLAKRQGYQLTPFSLLSN